MGTRSLVEPGARSASAGFFAVEHSPARVAAWREAYFYGIFIAAVFLPFDFFYSRHLWVTLAARGALVSTLVACHALLGRVDGRRASRVVVAGAAATAFLAPAPVVAARGGDGVRFGFLLVVPLVIAALLPEVPFVATLAGAVAMAAGLQILVAEGKPLALTVEWGVLSLALTAATAYGTRRVRRLHARAERAERDRRDAVARLEESERRRSDSERFAYVGRLAAGIGHEVNNPLCAVRGNLVYAREILERERAAPDALEAIVEAVAAAERIGRITADLRALSADEGEPLVPCSVPEAVAEAVAGATGRLGGTRVVLEALDPGLPRVLSQPRLLAAALTHLVTRGAEDAVASASPPPSTVRVAARALSGAVEIAVEDDGPLLPVDALDRIFEPFAVRGAAPGAGLGLMLPMTRELAERGGGRVAAARRDAWNRFTVTLAAAVPAP